jgi:hypothetical protein
VLIISRSGAQCPAFTFLLMYLSQSLYERKLWNLRLCESRECIQEVGINIVHLVVYCIVVSWIVGFGVTRCSVQCCYGKSWE